MPMGEYEADGEDDHSGDREYAPMPNGASRMAKPLSPLKIKRQNPLEAVSSRPGTNRLTMAATANNIAASAQRSRTSRTAHKSATPMAVKVKMAMLKDVQVTICSLRMYPEGMLCKNPTNK